MSSKRIASIVQVIELLEQAENALAQAEGLWELALERELASFSAPEIALLEDLFQASTHETRNSLGFWIQDIKVLLERIRIRKKFAIFTQDQFQEIVSSGWSTRLVAKLHGEIPEKTLAELSVLLKELCLEWGSVPKVLCSNIPQLNV